MNFNIPLKPKIKLKPRPPDNRQIAVMPLRALKDMELTNGSIRVLGLVCSYANRAGITWVSQARLAEDLGVTRSAITHHITALRKKNYLERIKKGRKSRFTSTLRVIYNEKISAEDAIAIAQLDEDLRSPVMIEREENRMTSRGVRTSRKGKTKEREYQGTSNELESLGEPSVTYNSKLESVLVLYRKIYKEEKVMNELDMKAIELAESIGLTNQEFATGLELWLNARPEMPDSIIDYARGL